MILNQDIEYYITDKLLEIEYWASVYIKSLYLSLFLSTSLFIGLSIEHLYLLRDTNQKILKKLTSVQGNNKQSTANFVFVDNVLVLPYEKNDVEKAVYLKENISNYSVLAKVQMQLEFDNYEMIKQFREQKQYIEDMISIILSSMTYQKILQDKSKITLKMNIRSKINKFLSRGKVKDIRNIEIRYL